MPCCCITPCLHHAHAAVCRQRLAEAARHQPPTVVTTSLTPIGQTRPCWPGAIVTLHMSHPPHAFQPSPDAPRLSVSHHTEALRPSCLSGPGVLRHFESRHASCAAHRPEFVDTQAARIQRLPQRGRRSLHLDPTGRFLGVFQTALSAPVHHYHGTMAPWHQLDPPSTES